MQQTTVQMNINNLVARKCLGCIILAIYKTANSRPISTIECEGWRQHSSLIFLILLFTKSNIEVSGWLSQTKKHFTHIVYQPFLRVLPPSFTLYYQKGINTLYCISDDILANVVCFIFTFYYQEVFTLWWLWLWRDSTMSVNHSAETWQVQF